MKTWQVIFLVKYSELWCADECAWIEHVERLRAATARHARRAFRKTTGRMRRCIVGRHVSTTLTSGAA